MREPHRPTRRFAVTYYPDDVTAAANRVYATGLLDTLSKHVVVCADAVETKYLRLPFG